MVKIVYGVAGEGSGHSSRARVIAKHLLEVGHEVKLASYDRGYRNLSEAFDVLEIEGLCIGTRDNRISLVKTFTENLKRLPKGHRTLQELRQTYFKAFQPDVVLTDFEPMTAYLANHYDLPLITIDNQHRMRYMEYEVPPGLATDSQISKTVIRTMVPRPDATLAITFYFGPPTNERTFFFPPILREDVLEAAAEPGEHILVYLTRGYESLMELLPKFSRERFRVYGYDRDDTDGVLAYRPFSQRGFLDDLRRAKAVIATAGFTLISEALFLRKPYLALPMGGQYEQVLNGYQLEQLGYGKTCSELTGEAVGDFLYRLPDYRRKLATYDAGDQGAIKRKLDEFLADDAALARDFHEHRR